MIWLKDAYDEYVVIWETGPFEIAPDLPLATAFLGIRQPYGGEDYWLETKIYPVLKYADGENVDLGWFDMHGIVEHNGGPQFTDLYPDELARDGRAFFQDILEERPEWFVNWYREYFHDERDDYSYGW